MVTAFETVYFWPELAQNFREVYRVLKPGGVFFICNEANGFILNKFSLRAFTFISPI